MLTPVRKVLTLSHDTTRSPVRPAVPSAPTAPAHAGGRKLRAGFGPRGVAGGSLFLPRQKPRMAARGRPLAYFCNACNACNAFPGEGRREVAVPRILEIISPVSASDNICHTDELGLDPVST